MDENVIKRYFVWEGHIVGSLERRNWRTRAPMTNHVSQRARSKYPANDVRARLREGFRLVRPSTGYLAARKDYDQGTILACADLKVVNVERLETVGELRERLEAAKRGRIVLEQRARLEHAKREFEAAQKRLESLQRGIK